MTTTPSLPAISKQHFDSAKCRVRQALADLFSLNVRDNHPNLAELTARTVFDRTGYRSIKAEWSADSRDLASKQKTAASAGNTDMPTLSPTIIDLFEYGSAEQLYSLIVGLMRDCGDEHDLWNKRASAMLDVALRALCHLRDQGVITLTAMTIYEHMPLDKIVELSERNDLPEHIIAPTRKYLETLPGFVVEDAIARKIQLKAYEHHGYLSMQICAAMEVLFDTHGLAANKDFRNYSALLAPIQDNSEPDEERGIDVDFPKAEESLKINKDHPDKFISISTISKAITDAEEKFGVEMIACSADLMPIADLLSIIADDYGVRVKPLLDAYTKGETSDESVANVRAFLAKANA